MILGSAGLPRPYALHLRTSADGFINLSFLCKQDAWGAPTGNNSQIQLINLQLLILVLTNKRVERSESENITRRQDLKG